MMLRTLSLFLLAGISVGSASMVSPSVKKSDKAFFGKDYPFDKRPAVDVLHFKHPYPVVQDSDEFDRDFVKDENKDNGEYAAQSEYDRLRHKLAKEKAEVEKASKAKTHAENELKEAVQREQAHKEMVRREQELKEKQRRAAEKKRGLISGDHEDTKGKDGKEADDDKTRKTYVVPKAPGGVAQSGDVDVASGETEEAMNKLEECKKELEKAREKLKQLTKDLDDAKKQQEGTQKAVDAAEQKFKKLEVKSEAAQAAAKKEYGEYQDAKDDYEKQQSLVAKMEADLKAAAAKVKAMRDGADKDGGVYPSPARSGGKPLYVAPLLALGAALLILLQ